MSGVAAGALHTCAIVATGDVECWGNLFEDSAEPVRGLERGAKAIGINGDETYEDHAGRRNSTRRCLRQTSLRLAE